MSRLSRITQKIFGASAGLNQIAQFGSLAAGTPNFTTDPALIQALSNYADGWFSAVLGGNSPTIEDTNALDFLVSRQLAYILQAGLAEWDSGTTYFVGNLVQSAGVIYQSLTDNNLNNAVTDPTNWGPNILATGAVNTAAIASRAVTGGQIAISTILSNNLGTNLNLPGKQVAANNNYLLVSNTNPATNELSVIRGAVGGGGSFPVISGEGFGVTPTGGGTFTVYFTTPFLDVPAVVLSGSAGGTVGPITILTTNGFESNSNQGFTFIAIGQRA